MFYYDITSQGGLIAAHVAILKPELFAGLILSSPNVEVDPKVGWFTVVIILILYTLPHVLIHTYVHVHACASAL